MALAERANEVLECLTVLADQLDRVRDDYNDCRVKAAQTEVEARTILVTGCHLVEYAFKGCKSQVVIETADLASFRSDELVGLTFIGETSFSTTGFISDAKVAFQYGETSTKDFRTICCRATVDRLSEYTMKNSNPGHVMIFKYSCYEIAKKQLEAVMRLSFEVSEYGRKEDAATPFLLKWFRKRGVEEDPSVKAKENERLTQEQQAVVDAVLDTDRSVNTTVLTGPPGTGKTRVLLEIAGEAFQCKRQVLVIAQTNQSLDRLHGKLTSDDRCEGRQVLRLKSRAHSHSNEKFLIDAMAIECPELKLEYDMLKEELSARFLDVTQPGDSFEIQNLTSKIMDVKRRAIGVLLCVSECILVTPAMLLYLNSIVTLRFDIVILEEAGTIPATALWPLFLNKIQHLLLTGDLYQLKPTQTRHNKAICSMLEFVAPFNVAHFRLRTVHRMSRLVFEWSRKRFYPDCESVHDDQIGFRKAGMTTLLPAVWLVQTPASFKEESVGTSRRNKLEAIAIRRYVNALSGVDVGVISPYAGAFYFASCHGRGDDKRS